MKTFFDEISDKIDGLLTGNETFTFNLLGEHTDFCRFNNAKVRQSGKVEQGKATFQLISGQKHCKFNFSLSGSSKLCVEKIKEKLPELRRLLEILPEDPHLMQKETVESSTYIQEKEDVNGEKIATDILKLTSDQDMVGYLTSGKIFRGFANSFGQRNWYETDSYNFDFSFFHHADKAVKLSSSGYHWKKQEFEHICANGKDQLAHLKTPSKTISPGKYRVYFTPAATAELLSIISWGGFSIKALKTKNSPLIKLWEKDATLDPRINLIENIDEGLAENFDMDGFIRPNKTTLIEKGEYRNALVSNRSAMEYGMETMASDSEGPDAAWMDGGDLDADNVLTELGSGLYVSNLWYTAFSDRANGKITGMTRFACFQVENGKIVAPINVMRFDESIFNILGQNLDKITKQRELLINSMTFENRSTDCAMLPGIIVNDVDFTL